MITSNDKFPILILIYKLYAMSATVSHSADVEKPVTPIKCTDCASLYPATGTNEIHRVGRHGELGLLRHSVLSRNKTKASAFSSLSDKTSENGTAVANLEDDDRFNLTINRRLLSSNTGNSDTYKMNSSTENVFQNVLRSDSSHYSSPVKRQIQPLDSMFGSFYIQRKLWFIPLYFSFGFGIYLWALIIKSMSRHRVFYPPIGAAVVPVGRAGDNFELIASAIEALERYVT